MTDNLSLKIDATASRLATAANGGARVTAETRLLAEIADIDEQIRDAYYSAQVSGRPVKPDWLHKALEARRHRANKLRDIGGDPGRPPSVAAVGSGEVERLTREVERLTAENERLTAENERIASELEAWAE